MAIFAIAGVLFFKYQIQLSNSGHLAVITIPVLFAGELCCMYKDWIRAHLIKWYIALPVLIVFLGMLKITGYWVEVGNEVNSHPILFYPMAAMGIFLCSYITHFIEREVHLSRLFCYIGKCSFYIMALHFLCFKIIDLIYSRINGITDAATISQFPHAYKLDLLYLVVGVSVPTIAVFAVSSVGKILREKMVWIQGK